MLDVGCWENWRIGELENWRVIDDCFELFQTISNQFKQCQTMSNYNFKFFLNFLSVSALRPDLSGNPFYKKRWEMFWVL